MIRFISQVPVRSIMHRNKKLEVQHELSWKLTRGKFSIGSYLVCEEFLFAGGPGACNCTQCLITKRVRVQASHKLSILNIAIRLLLQ
jgi:hypothetical protein